MKNHIMEKILFNRRLAPAKLFPKTLIFIFILLVIKYDIFHHVDLIKVEKNVKKFKTKVCLCAIAKE